MGVLYYGGPDGAIDIADRVLAHLKVVIAIKLRRGESFMLSWAHPDEQPGRRSAIWLHPSIPLRFLFEDAEPPELDTELIDHLESSASSSGGIRLLAEHVTTAPRHDRPVDYGAWTIGRLRTRARELGLTGYSDKRKADLIAMLSSR
ncbi:hypothetical protein CZ771_01270 [Actinomycetales bacterium JB111]|nr:hypothetical protein CZ771_01270 [Actinomycetales bacterium JB111]